jgi:hypothetical protein
VAEYPRPRATTGRDGTYDLAVPDRRAVTPYIVAAGYHTIYLQTFRTDGEDLERVNFQTPTTAVYQALATLLDVPLGPDGELRECAIVSTFSTRNIRDLSFRGFTGYGAHGVGGAMAFATPVLPGPIYFNENVVPDPAQRRSSVDGGVLWTGAPAGVYTIRARHPSTWLRVSRLPAGAIVRLTCSGPHCPFKRRTVTKSSGANLDLLGVLGGAGLGLRAGQRLEVLVTAHAYNGKLVRWRLREARAPRPVTRCVPLGNSRPQARCQAG